MQKHIAKSMEMIFIKNLTNIIYWEVKGPKTEVDQTVSQEPKKHSTQTEHHSHKTDELQGLLGLQTQRRSKPQEGRGGLKLLLQRPLHLGHQQAHGNHTIITIQTWPEGDSNRVNIKSNVTIFQPGRIVMCLKRNKACPYNIVLCCKTNALADNIKATKILTNGS